uniref:Macaca fascicularis brain cDNA clone: QmoA-11314, similar to human similar to CG4995 gene product (LOC153328), mRNA, RefSeq: NM_145282.1 n=1 Tax=Macaca fascicularis TaxID=9541 RepID=I7GN52_MACFA|nr:unnamed protein product [Macaca fascicularis]
MISIDFISTSVTPDLWVLSHMAARPQALPDESTHPSRPSAVHQPPQDPCPWLASPVPLSRRFSHTTMGDSYFYTCPSSASYSKFSKVLFYSLPQLGKDPELG